jgi:hypothetical protein
LILDRRKEFEDASLGGLTYSKLMCILKNSLVSDSTRSTGMVDFLLLIYEYRL